MAKNVRIKNDLGSSNFLLDVARGKVAGMSIFRKFGRNSDVDTGSVPETVWNGGGLYTGFDATDEEIVTVVSNNAADAAAGTGARTILIQGLNALGEKVSEIVTLNGTTPVDSVNSYWRCDRQVIQTAGSGGENAGTITVAQKATTANVFSVVAAGKNQSSICAYTVPARCTDYVISTGVTVNRDGTNAGARYANFELKSRRNGSVFQVKNFQGGSNQDSVFEEFSYAQVFPPLTDVKIDITSVSSTNMDVTGRILVLRVCN